MQIQHYRAMRMPRCPRSVSTNYLTRKELDHVCRFLCQSNGAGPGQPVFRDRFKRREHDALHGGAVQYGLFTPSTAAIAAMGYTGLPYRLVVHMPPSGFELSAVGGEGTQMSADVGGPARKLGYGSNANGSLAVPDANWPTLYALPQGMIGWTGTGISRNNNALMLMVNAIVEDLAANVGIDRSRIYLTGASAGTTQQLGMLYARHRRPQHFPVDFAGAIACACTISGSGFRQDLPEMHPHGAIHRQFRLRHPERQHRRFSTDSVGSAVVSADGILWCWRAEPSADMGLCLRQRVREWRNGGNGPAVGVADVAAVPPPPVPLRAVSSDHWARVLTDDATHAGAAFGQRHRGDRR